MPGSPAANRRTTPAAAAASQTARLSSRCVLSGARSPACSAIVHPFRLGSSLTSADTYLPACCHVSVRTNLPTGLTVALNRGDEARPSFAQAYALLKDDKDIATYTAYVGQGSPRFWLGLNAS